MLLLLLLLMMMMMMCNSELQSAIPGFRIPNRPTTQTSLGDLFSKQQ